MDRIHLLPKLRLVVLVIGLVPTNVTAQQVAPPASQQEFLERLTQLAKSAARPEPVGDHVIRGRVVTTTGEPVAGARIYATTTKDLYTSRDRRAFAEERYWEPDLARTVSASASAWFKRQARSRETTTADDGTFVLDHLDDGYFDVWALRDGFVIEAYSSPWRRHALAASDSNLELFAVPTYRRTFDLRLPDGSAPDRATLDFRRFGDPNGSDQGNWTPADPTVDLPAGDWIVKAAYGGDASRFRSIQNSKFVSPPTPVVSPSLDGSDTVKIALHGVCAIEGTIVPPPDAPRFYYDIQAVRLEPQQPPDPYLFSERARSGRRRTDPRPQVQSTNDRGLVYRIDSLEAGRWYVGVFRQRPAPPLMTAVLDVGENVVEHDFILPAPDPDRDTRIRVFDPAGAPLRDCEFQYRFTNADSNGVESSGGGGGGLQVFRTRDGEFTYSFTQPFVRFVLLASHPRFGTCSREVPAGVHDVEVRFVAPAAPTVRVPGFAEHSRNRKVELEWTRGSDERRDEFSKRIDDDAISADGTLDVGLLQPGRYRLVISVEPEKQKGGGMLEVARATWEVTPETQSLVLPFPPLAPLRLVVAAKTKGWFTLSPIDWTNNDGGRSQRTAEADADGGVTFVDVVPGKYTVRGPGTDSMLVEAPASGPIAFVAEAVNVLRVVVRDPAGALAKAGLATDDRIVAIDGQEFSGRQQLDFIRQSLKGEEVTLTVQRGDKRFEVVVSRSLLVGGPTADGTFYEAAR
jgi:hypothetical protein